MGARFVAEAGNYETSGANVPSFASLMVGRGDAIGLVGGEVTAGPLPLPTTIHRADH
jgi:hypothetical protein